MGIFAKLKASLQGRDDADRYLKGLDKSKKTFGDRLRRLANGFRGVDDEFLEEVMIILLEADVGIHTAEKITARLESEAARQRLKTFDEISECLVSVMLEMYQEHTDAEVQVNEDGTTVILLVGVNGSGKTTTAAKLTKTLSDQGNLPCRCGRPAGSLGRTSDRPLHQRKRKRRSQCRARGCLPLCV